jgi:hypothetical protein
MRTVFRNARSIHELYFFPTAVFMIDVILKGLCAICSHRAAGSHQGFLPLLGMGPHEKLVNVCEGVFVSAARLEEHEPVRFFLIFILLMMVKIIRLCYIC